MAIRASRTAVLVCQARAVADGRLAIGRFSDPVAVQLLTDDERRNVDVARGPVPSGFGDRLVYEFLSATTAVLVARTVAIDDAVRSAGHRQLVLLGAGLDARAWRMPELADTHVFEIDQPASQADKQARVAGVTPLARELTFLPVEFGRDRLSDALSDAGFHPSLPTTWIWEGVLPYLTEDAVGATLAELGPNSAPGSRLIATYQERTIITSSGRLLLKLLFGLARRHNPMANEAHVSSWEPEQMASLLAEHGFVVLSDVNQQSLAEEVGLENADSSHLRKGRVVVAERRAG